MSYLQDDLADTAMPRYSLMKERPAPLIAEDDQSSAFHLLWGLPQLKKTALPQIQ